MLPGNKQSQVTLHQLLFIFTINFVVEKATIQQNCLLFVPKAPPQLNFTQLFTKLCLVFMNDHKHIII